MYKIYVRLSLVLLSILWLSGCGLIDAYYLPPPEDTAQELFETANDFMAEKDYVAAVERYNKLRDEYPFSPYTVEAELSLGDAYFLDEEYPDAIEAYKDFESLHPRHAGIPYVLYQIGVANLNAFKSIDRPTNGLQEGYEYLARLLESYPDTQYTEPAKEIMLKSRKLMAEHELYIADVFYQMDKYNSAWQRYRYVIDHFQDVPTAVKYAKEKGLDAYHKHIKESGEEERLKKEGKWQDWFDWL